MLLTSVAFLLKLIPIMNCLSINCLSMVNVVSSLFVLCNIMPSKLTHSYVVIIFNTVLTKKHYFDIR